jgi:hypothetical protein
MGDVRDDRRGLGRGASIGPVSNPASLATEDVGAVLRLGFISINFVTIVTHLESRASPGFRHAFVSPLTIATVFPKTEIVP